MSTSTSLSLISASMRFISYNKRQIATIERVAPFRYWLMDYDPSTDSLNVGQVYSPPNGIRSTFPF